jgi:hypothetical protein
MRKRINSLFMVASMIISTTAFALVPQAPARPSNVSSAVDGDFNSTASEPFAEGEVGETEMGEEGQGEEGYDTRRAYAPRSPRATAACGRLRYAACYESPYCYPNIDPDSGNFLGCVPG